MLDIHVINSIHANWRQHFLATLKLLLLNRSGRFYNNGLSCVAPEPIQMIFVLYSF